MRKSNTNAYLALVIVSIFWGTTYLASSIGVRHMHGLLMAGLRQTTAGALLTGFFILKGYKLPDKIVLSRLFVIGIIMLCGSNGLLTMAMKYIPSGLGAIIAATVPIWITLFSYFLVQKVRFSPLLIVGMALGFIGVGGIFYDYLASLMNPEFRFGIILAIIGSILWALGSVLTAKWAVKVNVLYGAGFQMVFSGVVMLIISMLFMGERVTVESFTGELVGSLVYLILIGSILTYSAYIYALNNLPPSLVSIYAYINPIVAVLLGWILLGERLNWMMAFSSLVTVFGVYLVNSAFLKSKAAMTVELNKKVLTHA